MYNNVLPLSDGMFLIENINGYKDVVEVPKFLNTAIPSDFVIMQDTGLKDKNGKRICEGDIMKGVIEEGYRIRIQYDEHEHLIGEIKWDYDGFMWELHEADKRYIQELVHVGNKEVIGNIYQNPELLTI